MMNDVLAIILGGGRGARLWPLTDMRAKPAVPIAGKYRLIDIPMSNCIHAGISKIAILTQFLSVSLHHHITQAYHFDSFHGGWVRLLPAEQTGASSAWYQGTADAVRKQLVEIEASRARYVVILAGDHLYRMDYADFVERHVSSGADITLAVKPVSAEDAARFGVMKVDASGQVVDFAEKPQDPEVIQKFSCRDDDAQPLLGSMGIYVFNTEVLARLLREHSEDDFGGDILPAAIGKLRVMSYAFDGYWEDIGTIRSFYEANLALTDPDGPFSFIEPKPIYTRQRFLPCSRLTDVDMDRVWLAEGCQIEGARLEHSVIGVRSVIERGSVIRDSVLSGNDYYSRRREERVAERQPPIGIGEDTLIEGAIIDKNTRIGGGVTIRPFPRGTNLDAETYCVRDGIVIIPKKSVIPANTYIGPGADGQA